MVDNIEQIEFWNSEVADVWVDQQQVMDATLQPISDILLHRAAGELNERALDVGCGCGDTSLALSKLGLSVTGVDVSESMLQHARSRVSEKADLNFIKADAATYQFNEPFDLLLSRFGIMFFDKPLAAFQNLRAAMKPEGRMSFVCWQSPKLNHWVSLPMMAVKDLLPEAEAPDPLAPGPFAFADPERIRKTLSGASWKDIEIEDIRWSIKIGRNVDEAVQFVLKIGPLARALRELPAHATEEVQKRVRTTMENKAQSDGVLLEAASWLVSAKA